MPGFFGEKGGGCTACHRTEADPVVASTIFNLILPKKESEKEKAHPLISKKVPMGNCVRCHNRSGRVGISYMGMFEAEGYGTPYEEGGHSKKRLPGDRYYLSLPPDIHHEKGMVCIDCHTRDEIMGDGKNHSHYEQALEVECVSCHGQTNLGLTRRKKELNNIHKSENGSLQLIGKLDGKSHPLTPPKPGICIYQGHKRLTCGSCHSTWVPQCYGCHVKRDMRDTHLDKLTLQETPGWWEEGRSYLRYERPMLAVWNDKIVIVTPGCQDVVTLIDSAGKQAGTFNTFTMAALNPHTTQRAGRSCKDCHASTKTVGLGEGTAWREGSTWHFAPLDQGVETAAGTTPPLDGYVDINGKPLQKSSRPDLRPFNGEELARILRIGLCVECHPHYTDAAYKNYSKETNCPVFQE
jgi:ribosomal protein L31